MRSLTDGAQLRKLSLREVDEEEASAPQAPSEAALAALRRALDDAADAMHKARAAGRHALRATFSCLLTRSLPPHFQRQVEARVPLTPALVAEHARSVATAARAAFPSLAALSPLARLLAGDAPPHPEAISPALAELWGPGGKQLLRGKLASDTLGRNDKTRALLRLQAAGEGRPLREAPPLSAEEQAAMVAYARRKAAAAAHLERAAEEDFDDDPAREAPWARHGSLAATLAGVGDGVKLRPF